VNYYSHHIGDYRRDTAHLSLLEHGIYRQMLDQYYLDERPIFVDDAKLMRFLCARSADEMQAVKNVLSDFFVLTDAGYMHKRCDVEIEVFHGKSKSASESANTRWERVRAEKDAKSCEFNANALPTQSEGNANALPTQSEGNANQEPITNNQEPRTKNQEPVKEKTSKSAPPPALPDWIPADAWTAFAAMRKSIKKPLTDSAVPLAVSKLGKLRDAGNDPRAVLEQSTLNSWQGLFEVRREVVASPAGEYRHPQGAPSDLAAAQRAANEEAKRRLGFSFDGEVIDATA
jgi:uncharacterized protein YdaU (DUF1376 family)